MENYRHNVAHTIHVAVGVILNSQQQVLVARRAEHAEQGGLWEFPGGKIEATENSYQALCRELREELGITVITAEPLLQFGHDYSKYHVNLITWMVRKFSGQPLGLEGQPLKWVNIHELANLEFPAANQKIIAQLQCKLISLTVCRSKR